jgi:hypothetical protein
LGLIIHCSLNSDADVYKRIKLATAVFGGSKNLFGDKCLYEKVKGQVRTALVLSTFLYGLEVWSLREGFASATLEHTQPLCPQDVSHQHRPH